MLNTHQSDHEESIGIFVGGSLLRRWARFIYAPILPVQISFGVGIAPATVEFRWLLPAFPGCLIFNIVYSGF